MLCERSRKKRNPWLRNDEIKIIHCADTRVPHINTALLSPSHGMDDESRAEAEGEQRKQNKNKLAHQHATLAGRSLAGWQTESAPKLFACYIPTSCKRVVIVVHHFEFWMSSPWSALWFKNRIRFWKESPVCRMWKPNQRLLDVHTILHKNHKKHICL